MGRPRGRAKTARISVSFEPQVYAVLVDLAKHQDVPVAQVIRRAVAQLVAGQQVREAMSDQPRPSPRATAARAAL